MKKTIPTVLVVMSQFLASCATHPTAQTYYAPTADLVAISDDQPEVDTGNNVAATEERRNPSSSLEGTPWTTWSEHGTYGGLLVLKPIREKLMHNNLLDPHLSYSAYKQVDCEKTNKNFRSADGTCTDLKRPNVGAAGVAFGRNVSPAFIDKQAEQKIMSPSPALVSKEFFTRDEFKPVGFLNMLAAVWIQFMNHDWLTHGKNLESNPRRIMTEDGTERVVERTKTLAGKPGFNKDFGIVSANDVTHWWDGSQIYGSSQEDQNQVRSFSRGKMRTVVVDGREILPKNNNLNVAYNKQNQGYEVTGFRDNWWVGLSMLHTLFVKEHNAIADMLMEKHARYDQNSSSWIWTNGKEVKTLDEKGLDEQIFQTARLINAAIMAKIHTVEWTPAILPNATLKKAMFTNWYGLANPMTWSKHLKQVPALQKTDWFRGVNLGFLIGGVVGDKANDYGAPYSITEEFTSVYRLHSLLPEILNFKKLNDKGYANPVPFADTRNDSSYGIMEKNDLKDLYYSFGTQHPGQLALNNFPKFMQELNIPGHGMMDLGMVDVLRDRERGTPRYNQFRRGIQLKPITSYRDFFPANKPLDARQEKILEKFYKVYGRDSTGKDNVEAIDLLVGTLAEEVRPKSFGFGETMFQIFILMASRRLMTDRFYTDNYRKEYYTQSGLDWIDYQGRLSQVIVRHMPELKDKVAGLETAFQPWRE
jgi:hypothetical protein